MEVVILAGGYGTRLKSVSNHLPKCMVPVNGEPFLAGLIKKIVPKGTKIILAVSYKRQSIVSFFGNKFHDCKICYSIEEKPLGTGGAIKQALLQCKNDNIVVLNGDTFFDINLVSFLKKHDETNSDISLVLKELMKPYRYGTVTLKESRIVSFNEKQTIPYGLINCGIYSLKREILEDEGNEFSFEMYLEQNLEKCISGFIYKEYFVDIGIPVDYKRAIEDSIFS